MKTRTYKGTTVREAMARLSGGMSSFDEIATASPTAQIDLKSVYPLSRLRDRVIGVSGGSVTQANGLFNVSTSTDPASEVLFRSVERGRYVAGFDGTPGMGVSVPQRPTGNQTIEWGYTDFLNGYVVGEDADGLYTALYVDGVRQRVRRRLDWVDPLEGELDPSKLTVYRMPFRWYGAGPFLLKVSMVIDDAGQMIAADTTEIETTGETITRDPNQPLSMRVQNNGTAAALQGLVAGRQFFINGSYYPSRRVSSIARVEQTVGTTLTPLIAFRQKADTLYDSITIKMQGVSIISTENLIWQLIVLPAGVDGTWINPDRSDNGTETALEFNITATTFTNGVKIYEDVLAAGQGNLSGSTSADLPNVDVPGGQDVAVLAARTVSGTATVTSVMRAREEW